MWGADFFVLPSRGEPFGIVVLEAMASGLPVIVTDEGGPVELITDGLDGLVVPTDDAGAMAAAMERLLRMGEDETANMKAAAEARLENFTSAALAARQMEIYERVLAEYRG